MLGSVMTKMTKRPPETTQKLLHAISCELGEAELEVEKAEQRHGRWFVPVKVSDYGLWVANRGALIGVAHHANPNIDLEFDPALKIIWVRGPRSSNTHVVNAAGRFLYEVKQRFQTTVSEGDRRKLTERYFRDGDRVWDRRDWLARRRQEAAAD